ncbi:hypothetical protein [Methylomonas sp. AM2-LC]|uniref:hypothetical protein n=1 Tax=Methylomonas sp. AM2-LC TaxID=3153301 RepID=UPI003267B15E
MSEILILGFWMLVIATIAFAPLGYFIYRYVAKNGEPFGDIEPHGDSESPVLALAEKVISKIKAQISKK